MKQTVDWRPLIELRCVLFIKGNSVGENGVFYCCHLDSYWRNKPTYKGAPGIFNPNLPSFYSKVSDIVSIDRHLRTFFERYKKHYPPILVAKLFLFEQVKAIGLLLKGVTKKVHDSPKNVISSILWIHSTWRDCPRLLLYVRGYVMRNMFFLGVFIK